MKLWDQLFSLFCIIIGLLVFLFAAGEIVLRLLVALLGLLLVNFGLNVRGYQSLQWMAIRMWSNRYNL